MSSGTVYRQNVLIEFLEYHRRPSKLRLSLLMLFTGPFYAPPPPPQLYRARFLYPVSLNLSQVTEVFSISACHFPLRGK
jgi:hypothetical protein